MSNGGKSALIQLGLIAGQAVLCGISAAVLRKMPDGTTTEVILDSDSDTDYIRKVRDDYVMQGDDIAVYVKP